MLRSALLYLSSQPKVFSFVRHNRMAKGFASRFVAGETMDTALAAVKKLNNKGISASLDLLGESVRNEKEARDTARQYIQLLDRIKESGLDANVSVKLTVHSSFGPYFFKRSKKYCVSFSEVIWRVRIKTPNSATE